MQRDNLKVIDKICLAMIDLLKDKDYRKITISDLIAKAGVNRSSYYYHFYDKKEVIDKIIDSICKDIVNPDTTEANKEHIGQNDMTDMRISQFQSYLDHFEEIKTLYSAGFQANFEFQLREQLSEQLHKYTATYINKNGEEEVLSDGVLYNIKIQESVESTIADLFLLVKYDFAIPLGQFIEMTYVAKQLRFKSATIKKQKKRKVIKK